MRWVDEPFQFTISAGFMLADRLDDSDTLLENVVLTAVISYIVTQIACAAGATAAPF
jgi:hypothetical protein